MKVVLAAPSRFHFVDLATQLVRHDALTRLYSGYSRRGLHATNIPHTKLATFPWIHTLFMASQRYAAGQSKSTEIFDWIDRISFDRYISATLPRCDVFTAISGCGLRSGISAKKRGAKYVCDRGSTHISYQNKILEEEHSAWNVPFTPTHPGIIDRELREYEEANLITIPSAYAEQTFLQAGIKKKKLAVIPYGVDLETFKTTPNQVAGNLDRNELIVAYVGGINLRKGVQYLFQAFARVKHPRKSLWLIGQADRRFLDRMTSLRLCPPEAVFFGHVEQSHLSNYLSRASLLALPSVEDGFGMVVGQAMACGCPVVASTHTGGSEIIENGVNGYVVPAREVVSLADAMEAIAHRPLQNRMRDAALNSVQRIGGWRNYGDKVLSVYRSIIENDGE